jgi:putative ABC transport system permease protein
MKLSRIIQIAWQGLIRNKMRSLLTMLGIIIGVAAVIIMIAVSTGTEVTIAEQINRLGTNLVFVQPNFSREREGNHSTSHGLVYDDAFAIIKEVQGVDAMVVEQGSTQTIQVENTILQSISIVGTTPDFPIVRDMTLKSGRYFSQSDLDQKQKVVILGSTLATELFKDTPPVGQTVSVADTKFAVIGVFDPKGIVGDVDFDARLYMPIKIVFSKYIPAQFARFMGDRVRTIYVKISNGASIDDVILQIQLLLARRHKVTLEQADFIVRTQQSVISTQEATTAAFRSLLAWVAAVSLVVGGIGIMNIMMVSVTERTREIGIRQAVGASPNDIRWQFLTEALLLSMVGGVIGVITGVGGSWLFGIVGNMRTVIVPSSILLAFSSAAAVGIFFGYYPANKAAQLDPIEALRHE